MRVRLLEDWTYYKKGQVLTQDNELAKELIQEKIAEPMFGKSEDEKVFESLVMRLQGDEEE